mgnify:CR=1 FL=1
MTNYKTEILLNDSQKELFWKTVGTCRYIYNLYLDKEKEYYEKKKKFLSAYSFGKEITKLSSTEEFKWIKEISSKAVKQTIINAEKAYKRFFRLKKGYPRYKSRHNNNCSYYFVKTDAKAIIKCERHRIKIPCLGWVQLREFGYIPVTGKDIISSGNISFKAGKFFISVVCRGFRELKSIEEKSEGIGIDLGLKDLAILSNGEKIKNPSKTKSGKRKIKRIKLENRKFSRKKRNSKNRDKQKVKLQKAYQNYSFYKNDYINKKVFNVVRTNPQYITLEDLNISGMMKNHKLAGSFQKSSLSQFKTTLIAKAQQYKIELREVDRFFPSSKLCSKCSALQDMPLKERIYYCSCGNTIDRDINAAVNLKQAEVFRFILPKAIGKVTPVEC